MALNESVKDVIKRLRPDIIDRLDKEGCWNYQVYGAMSLDDACAIEVRLIFGQTEETSRIRIRISGTYSVQEIAGA